MWNEGILISLTDGITLGPVPTVNPDTYQLLIDGLVKNSRTFSLAELEERFEKVEVVAALQVRYPSSYLPITHMI